MRTQVFISYRRNGGLAVAEDIYNHLSESYEVFFDMKSLRNGRFDLNIEEAIGRCTDFILILSNQIFSRFEDEGDWISRELELALKGSKNIIPVFLDDFVQPVTDNERIKTVLHYNGIKYSDEMFYDRLAGFMLSNEKRVLNIECDGEGYKLADSAIDVLKEIYRRTRQTKEYGVRIVLDYPDLDTAADKLVPETTDGPRHIAVMNKKIHLGCTQARRRDVLEQAIEFMIGDTANVEHGSLWNLLKDEPLTKEWYLDDNNKIQTYFAVCVWVHVINELLKEITLPQGGRQNQYRNVERDKYTKIECTRWDRPIWGFTSLAGKEECGESVDYYQIFRPSPFCLSPETVLTMILPDFYYKVAQELLYSDSEKLRQDLSDRECTIRILECYWFGLA